VHNVLSGTLTLYTTTSTDKSRHEKQLTIRTFNPLSANPGLSYPKQLDIAWLNHKHSLSY